MRSQQRSKKSLKSIITFTVVCLLLVYSGYVFVSTQLQISEKNNELMTLRDENAAYQIENESLEHYTRDENLTEYVENIARNKLDYAFPEERIYYVMPGEAE